MDKYTNQEAFMLAAKRVTSRVQRAKELKVDTLDSAGLKDLVETLSLAKAIEREVSVDEVRKGQEYYVQTLLDSLNLSTEKVMDLEYKSAVFELGTESEILASIEALKAA